MSVHKIGEIATQRALLLCVKSSYFFLISFVVNHLTSHKRIPVSRFEVAYTQHHLRACEHRHLRRILMHTRMNALQAKKAKNVVLILQLLVKLECKLHTTTRAVWKYVIWVKFCPTVKLQSV